MLLSSLEGRGARRSLGRWAERCQLVGWWLGRGVLGLLHCFPLPPERNGRMEVFDQEPGRELDVVLVAFQALRCSGNHASEAGRILQEALKNTPGIEWPQWDCCTYFTKGKGTVVQSGLRGSTPLADRLDTSGGDTRRNATLTQPNETEPQRNCCNINEMRMES